MLQFFQEYITKHFYSRCHSFLKNRKIMSARCHNSLIYNMVLHVVHHYSLYSKSRAILVTDIMGVTTD